MQANKEKKINLCQHLAATATFRQEEEKTMNKAIFSNVFFQYVQQRHFLHPMRWSDQCMKEINTELSKTEICIFVVKDCWGQPYFVYWT